MERRFFYVSKSGQSKRASLALPSERGFTAMQENRRQKGRQPGLYSPSFEHDACGIGAVVDIKGRKSHKTVDDALKIVEKLEHRAGKDAEGKTGDGVGILLQISHRFFSKAVKQAGFSLPGERDYGVGAQILRQIGIGKMRLLTNNPVKRVGLEAYGLEITESLPLEIEPNPYNLKYMRTKKERMGHTLHRVD